MPADGAEPLDRDPSPTLGDPVDGDVAELSITGWVDDPAGATYTVPVSGFPVKSISRACARPSAFSYASGPTRTTSQGNGSRAGPAVTLPSAS